MKKLSVLPLLAVIFLLVACNNTDVTVCRSEYNGRGVTTTLESNGNEIVLATTVLKIDISGWDDEEIQSEIEWNTNHEDEVVYEIDGDTLILTQIIDGEELGELVGAEMSQGLNGMVTLMEDNGATCVTE